MLEVADLVAGADPTWQRIELTRQMTEVSHDFGQRSCVRLVLDNE
jgi:hypothetical protein